MTLEELAKKCEQLRTEAIFGELTSGSGPDAPDSLIDMERDGVLDVLAGQELLQALAFLDLAHRAAMKAHYHQARALAQSPFRH